MLASSGHVREAVTHHAAYYKLWSTYGGIPERYNYQSKVPEIAVYPLRPEFVESTYTLHRVTKDPFYREVGRQIMCDLEEHTRVACGYATLHSVQTKEKEDRMESFFLSETIKYLYLLFDDANVLHNKAWNHVFTTQVCWRCALSVPALQRGVGWACRAIGGEGGCALLSCTGAPPRVPPCSWCWHGCC